MKFARRIRLTLLASKSCAWDESGILQMSRCARMLLGVLLSTLLLVGCDDRCQNPGGVQNLSQVLTSAPPAADTKIETRPIVIEASLLFGTVSNAPPDPRYLPVDPALSARLNKMGLRRPNYFLVSKTRFGAPFTVEQTRSLSDGCQLKIRSVTNDTFEVTVLRSGKTTARRMQSFRKDELLVFGGDFPSGTSSWVVVLRRLP